VTPRRVLITGGSGFLGTHVARRLARDGIRVRVFDTVEADGFDGDEIDHVRGDVRDPAAFSRALDDVDVVVHAAFVSSRQTRELIRSVNVDGTLNVCEQSLARGVRRLVLISSTIVSRPLRIHPVFRDSPQTRLALYRDSRAEAERLVERFRPKGLPVAIVRPKTFVGPGRVGAFAIIFEWIRSGRVVVVLGRGRNRYQLLDTRDMAEGVRGLIEADVEGLYFFGAREFGRVRDDLQALLDHSGSGARLAFVPPGLAKTALRGMELANLVPASEWHYMSASGQDSVVDIVSAERDLGWRPVHSNVQSLTDAYDWYVKTVRASGSAPTTHPVPLTHRVLKRLMWILPR
jgi:nucleoside-diphosphate-sugar epimerase